MNATGKEEFVGEALKPLEGAFKTGGTAAGEPVLPQRFKWRDREYTVESVLRKWKESTGCKSGGGESYLRKHWYHLRTTDGSEFQIYFERQARSASSRKKRWWIYAATLPGS